MWAKAGFYWVRYRVWGTQWWSGETPHAKGALGLLQVETSLVQSESVRERENESVSGEHSFECYVADWLLDSVKAKRTNVGILVRTPTTTSQLSVRSFTVRDTIWPEFSLSAQLICTFARNPVWRGILSVLRATILCTRR